MNKKVYLTSLHLMHGGVEMAITSLCNSLVKRGYDVEILCTYKLGTPAYELDSRIKIRYLTNVRPNREEFLSAVADRNIFRILREGLYSIKVLYLKKKVLKDSFRSIDEGIIISTRNEDSVILSKYGGKNVLKIAQLHHDHRFDKKLLGDFKNKYFGIDIFALLTDKLRREVSEIMHNNTHTRCVTMPNFLPSETLAHVNDFSARKNQAVAVGRLNEVKGFLRLIRIWSKVSKTSDTVLKIIGDGDQRAVLEAEISKLGLDDTVILTGSLSHGEVLREMKQSLIYAMTSFTEGFPFVLIEAMSQGLPAIAYDVRVGPEAIIENGKSGFLIPDNDETAFVQKTLLLLNDDEKRNEMSKQALLRAEDFSEEIIVPRWEALFGTLKEEVLSEDKVEIFQPVK